MKLQLQEFERDAKFLFFTMIQAALKMREMSQNKEQFVLFAEEIWNTMEMNDEETLRTLLMQSMLVDVNDLLK